MHATMSTLAVRPLPRLRALPATLPQEGAVRLELVEGVPVLKATALIQSRVEKLLFKGKTIGLTAGRATVLVLTLNRERIMDIRAADWMIGRHPPPGDPVQEEAR